MTDKYKTIQKDLGSKKLSDGEKTVEIKVKNVEIGVEKDKYEDGKETTIFAELIVKDKEGNRIDSESKANQEIAKCIIKRGMFYDTIELPKKLADGIELKEDEKLSVAVEG